MPAWKKFERKGLRLQTTIGCAKRNTPHDRGAALQRARTAHNARAGLPLCAFMALNAFVRPQTSRPPQLATYVTIPVEDKTAFTGSSAFLPQTKASSISPCDKTAVAVDRRFYLTLSLYTNANSWISTLNIKVHKIARMIISKSKRKGQLKYLRTFFCESFPVTHREFPIKK